MFIRRLLSLALVTGLVLGLSGLALAGIPDPDQSTISATDGVLFISPDGAGETLAQKSLTIGVNIVDGNGVAINQFPAGDIWLDDFGAVSPQGINLCQGGSTADANTDINGDTTISGTINGGGWVQSGMAVYVSGNAILGGTGAPFGLDINSPDINGDRIVDLIDIGLFSADLLTYQFRSDFVDCCAAPIDLSDIGRFAAFIGVECQ